ncbi:MAG: amidohydrolase [Kineosporiaceae bacterium]
MRTLYRNGRIHTRAAPGATAMLVDGRPGGAVVAWVGSQEAAADLAGAGVTEVDLAGALVTPAFVDGHVHCLDTGLHQLGVDVTTARTVADVLDRVATAARARPGAPVLGHGWDETRLAEGRPPTMAELDRAAPGAVVYLSRVDVHSAVVSPALATVARLVDLAGWDPAGRVERDAHHAARAAARDLGPSARRDAHEAALRAAAAAGIGTVHEMGGPDLAGPVDLPVLVETARAVGLGLRAYWGQLAGEGPGERSGVADALAASGLDPADPADPADVAGLVGLAGLAGDLCVDGSIGSRTAAFREPYADADTRGRLYLTPAEVAGHVAACGRAGVQAGFHVIGDAGLDAILDGLDLAARDAGEATVRQARVRLEHVEAADDEQVRRLVSHAATASVQPAFSATWGGPTGMYATRLGGERAARLNRFAALATAGVPLALGSDSPVTPFDPWGAVAAATAHEDPAARLSARAAFAAHTRGAHRAADGPGATAGVLTPGAPATFAVWEVGELVVHVPDGRVQAWSTDPRSATPPLPALGPDRPAPRCLRTVVTGQPVHDSGDLG